ncbi:MAG: flagellar hook protein FlgE [Actinobacteria bacterium]|nr:flagellar hook protein FlgE [Actinomycetota bacterium]
MLRSLFAGISGLRAHQQMMDVVGNNIANVNTVGYKTSQAVFQDTLSQMLKAAGAPQGNSGGTNPAQIGLGVRMATIGVNFTQGAAQTTGRSTDLMINGDGFFVVRNGPDQLYTRAGSFSFDATGRLVDPQGNVAQGWLATAGVVNPNTAVGDVRLPINALLQPTQTTSVTVGGNLPSDTTNPTPITKTITTYDVQGNPLTFSVTFTKTSPTDWDVVATDGVSSDAQSINFAANGTTPNPTTLTVGAAIVDLSGMTDYAGADTSAVLGQNGSTMGSLQSFSISQEGTVVGVFSNGLKQSLAQIALSSFNNPPGLEKLGNSLYRSTVNSGPPQLGQAGSGGRGLLQGGALEMSNVDLAQEFTNMIIAQRGFQANSKVIATSDELLQDLVNLKR